MLWVKIHEILGGVGLQLKNIWLDFGNEFFQLFHHRVTDRALQAGLWIMNSTGGGLDSL